MSTVFKTSSSDPAAPADAAGRRRHYAVDARAVGEPYLWGLGGALALGMLLVAGFLVLIFWNGIVTFWPGPIHEVTLKDDARLAGEPFRDESYRPGPGVLAGLTDEDRRAIEAAGGFAHRTLYRIGNYDLYNEDFRWVSDFQVENIATPEDLYYFERQEWGPFIGTVSRVTIDGETHDFAALDRGRLRAEQSRARERFAEIRRIEQDEIGAVNHYIEEARLALREVALEHGEDSDRYQEASNATEQRIAELEAEYQALAARAAAIKEQDSRFRVTLSEINGAEKELPISQIVRFYPANQLSTFGKLGVYFSRWGEFLTSEPREANTEGGILPAIFGTVAMTLIMVVFVAPLGVITALYLREYAKQGRLVSIVRISVNNLAGVPSIVYGVFGLGFFAYTMGSTIDQLFYAERLPNPTFGTGGILWASLTLALLTVPVVIVASEEALAAVPRSMREGSLACGASTWQTIRYVVLPRAMPGVMTGLILAMARGAGEVAPLMLVGVVKLAPELPIDGFFPYIHLERSFMHLGFHIFDVGFQSRNSEAGKPMVFVTTMLLLGLIVLMNAAAILVRNRLKKKYAEGGFDANLQPEIDMNATVTSTRPREIPETAYYVRTSGDGDIVSVKDFNLWYGQVQALFDITMNVPRGLVTAMIGPSGCGKSTLLRCMNRMNDLIDTVRIAGTMRVDEQDIYGKGVDVIGLRKRMGMVFQKPNPFAMTVFDNVIYPLRVDGITNSRVLEETCERALRGAALWDEVKDRLRESALGLSGGQQQRLCIARAIAADPEVLLMDEPCSALDPIATAKVEELIDELKGQYSIVIVTHNMQQAARVSDNTAFMYLGKLVEFGDTEVMFTNPKLSQTSDYITGRFG